MTEFDDEFDGDPRGFPGQLSFIHKRIGAAIKGTIVSAVTGGNPLVGGFGGFIGPTGPPKQSSAPTTALGQCAAINRARATKGLPPRTVADCMRRLEGSGTFAPTVMASTFDPSDFGHGTAPEDFGEAVMGRFGAALVPASVATTTLRCPRGAVLGIDNLCYNKRDLHKDQRKWVPGRKPLLTGGDLNAISRAARAARKMATQTKRLQLLGLMPKSATTKRKKGHGHTVVST